MYNFVLNYDGAALKICQFITSKCVKHIRFKIKIPSPAKAVNFWASADASCDIYAKYRLRSQKKRELPHPLPINLKNTKI
mgnify:CR=1 FL=1